MQKKLVLVTSTVYIIRIKSIFNEFLSTLKLFIIFTLNLCTFHEKLKNSVKQTFNFFFQRKQINFVEKKKRTSKLCTCTCFKNVNTETSQTFEE